MKAADNSQFLRADTGVSPDNSQFKKDLLGMSLTELQQLCAIEGMPKFAARQICDWLYAKRVDSIDAMTNLSLKARSRLNEIAYIGRILQYNARSQKTVPRNTYLKLKI